MHFPNRSRMCKGCILSSGRKPERSSLHAPFRSPDFPWPPFAERLPDLREETSRIKGDIQATRWNTSPRPDMGGRLFYEDAPAVIDGKWGLLKTGEAVTAVQIPKQKGTPKSGVPSECLFFSPFSAYPHFFSNSPIGTSKSRKNGVRMPALQPLEEPSVLKDHVALVRSSP